MPITPACQRSDHSRIEAQSGQPSSRSTRCAASASASSSYRRRRSLSSSRLCAQVARLGVVAGQQQPQPLLGVAHAARRR